MLVLGEKDIYLNTRPEDIINAVEKAYLLQSSGDFIMPDRLHLEHGQNTCLLMPCIADKLSVTKLVSITPGNKGKNIPVIQGTIQLTDQSTGIILGLLHGGSVTALRTGAVGAVAMKYLTHPSQNKIGIIGAGVQGWHLAWMALTVRPEAIIMLYDRNPEKSTWFIGMLKSMKSDAEVNLTSSIEECVAWSDVIFTATNSPTPVLPEDVNLLKNRTYIGIGSFRPIMGELPRSLYPLISKLYVDIEYAMQESGDVNYPLQEGILTEEQIIPFHKIITGEDLSTDKTQVFKSVGMALFDLKAAETIYQRAILSSIGTEIDL